MTLHDFIFPTCLLHGENLVVEVLLQLFVGKIDTELFETVVVKVLKTKDVQNTWRGGEGMGRES